MRLYNVKVQGFGRFETEESLNVSSKMTAVVGPNEAGKTTLLKAISYFSDNRTISEADKTSLSEVSVKLTLSLFLDPADLEASGLSGPTWLHLSKEADGDVTYDLQPPPPRDLNLRQQAAIALRRISSTKTLLRELADDHRVEASGIEEGERLLRTEDEFSVSELQTLATLGAALQSASPAKFQERLAAGSAAITEALAFERSYDPHQDAINILAGRRPTILNFTSQYRDIQLPYNITLYKHEQQPIRRNPSKALAEILRLAGLSLDELKSAIDTGNDAVKAGLLSAANEKLALLSRAWRQSDASLYLIMDGPHLNVLVRNVKDFDARDQFASFASRSEGYRQFIALQIFTFLKKSSDAILLIDEIEQHLHYDAQADLIQILQDESTVGNVIYTTHSAGALPEDLGVGVRMVRWDTETKKRSRIINKFWHGNSAAGFKPLLFGMGATTFAFFPTRRALIGEGPTEMLLLPRLLREALKRTSLDFQIVHGLSNISPKGLPMLDHEGSGVCYITDSDSSGRDLSLGLKKAGVPPERIFSVSDVKRALITVEDLVEKGAWIEAVNRYIDMYGEARGVKDRLKTAPAQGRIKALPASIQKEKVAFAYNILRLLRENPNREILDPSCRAGLRQLGENLRLALKLTDDPVSATFE